MTNHPFDYLDLSSRTASGHFHGELVALSEIEEAFKDFIAAAEKIDRIKKLLFYGEDPAKGRVKSTNALQDDIDAAQCTGAIATELNIDPSAGIYATEEECRSAEYILHSVLGVATEAGEMVEAIQKTVFGGQTLDLVNLGEESGDVKWYLAMLARVRGVAWDADERRNIEKLQLRFPDKFTTEAANERNLDAERAVLEGNPVKAIRPILNEIAEKLGLSVDHESLNDLEAQLEQPVSVDELNALTAVYILRDLGYTVIPPENEPVTSGYMRVESVHNAPIMTPEQGAE